MLSVPSELLYTQSHEWIDPDDDPHRVGVTDFAQSELSDIVFVELPEVGQMLTKGIPCAVVESTKAASDVYAPATGIVAEINTNLESQPELVNQDPYGDGWLFVIELTQEEEMESLMDSDKYKEMLSQD